MGSDGAGVRRPFGEMGKTHDLNSETESLREKSRNTMFRQGLPNEPVLVSIFLVPNFTLVAFTSLIEPMRLTNWLSGREIFRWQIVSRDGNGVIASNGVTISADLAMSDLQRPANVVVCAGLDAHLFNDAITLGFLRRWAREGAHVGSMDTGAYILARAGLLNGYRCTIHWYSLDSFAEEFPDVEVRAELFEIDRDRFTCAGGIAGFDMMMREATLLAGNDIAAQVSEQIMHERVREGHDDQRLPLQARLRVSHPKLIKAIAAMEKHTEEALSRDEIASQVGLSRRQLERLFRRYLSTSPARYYLKLRLNRARTLLTQTTMPVTEVAFASGFTSASHFSKCYRDMFGRTPRAERRHELAANDGEFPIDPDDSIDIDDD